MRRLHPTPDGDSGIPCGVLVFIATAALLLGAFIGIHAAVA